MTNNTTKTLTAETLIAEEALCAELTAADCVAVLNQTEDKNLHAPILAVIEEKLKAENSASIKATIKDFAQTAQTDLSKFWGDFIQNPNAPIFKLSEDKESGEYTLKAGTKRILFSKVDAVFQDENNGESIANAKNYLRMIARITDNLYRATCIDLSAGVDRKLAVVRVKATIDGEETMREVDFTKTSNGGICEQMQAFVDTVMPDGQRVLLRNADVNYVRLSIANGKDGNVTTGKEGAVERLIFDAIAKRYTQTAYNVASKAACHKEPKAPKAERTEKQEEVMSKVAERPESAATLSKKEKSEKKAA